MRLATPRARLAAALLALAAPAAASAGPIDSILLRWREQVAKCGPRGSEASTNRDQESLVSVSMFEAVNAIEGKYAPFVARLAAAPGSSADAAAAQAARDVLVKACAAQTAAFDATLKESLAGVRDSAARENGVAVGRQAAAAVLAARAGSKAVGSDPYFTATTAGTWVPAAPQRGVAWSRTTPWIMKAPDELRPAAPPSLTSETWKRALRDIQRMGGSKSTERTRAQTDVAQFWAPRDVRLVVRQLIGLPGRTLADDARLLALTDMAWADSYVAMMDGKYAFNFWRPVTAVRHAAGGQTALDEAWEPLIPTPPHPEYPCGHCASAAAVGTVIAEEFGDRMPPIVLDYENALVRRFSTAQEYIDEVADARVFGGVHYRFSADAGKAMGVSIGKLAAQRHFRPLVYGGRPPK